MNEDPLDKARSGLIAGQGKGLMIAVLATCGILILAIIMLVSVLAAGHSGDLQRFVNRLMTPSPSPSPPSSVAPVAISVAPSAGSEPPAIVTVPPPPPVEMVTPAAAPPIPSGNMGGWFPQDSYPAEARRRNEQGRVVIILRIDPSGRPRKCRLVSSSGSGWLDAATCRLALRNGRFTPARGVDGEPVWSDFRVPAVKWQIED